MNRVVRAFATWSQGKSETAPCPTVQELRAAGLELPETFASKLRTTCREQPEGQAIGVVWAGVDGKLGTKDDLRSWLQPAPAVRPALGPRWGKKLRPPAPRSTPRASSKFVDKDGDGIPDVR